MDNDIKSMKEHYNSNLKAKEYNEKFNRILKLIRGNFEFMLQFLHEIVQAGRFSGSKVFEVGSGATVHNIASASAKYTAIVQSDYVLDNCEELRRWHRGQSVLDWSDFLDIVLLLEGKDGDLPKGRQDLESRIRSSVKCVVRGDLLTDDILDVQELPPEARPPFDLVLSVLCIETAAPDLEGYIAILRRLRNLLRPGGGIVVCGYENGSPWKIGDSVFHHVKLSLEQIYEAFQKAGFGNFNIKTRPKTKSEYEWEYDSLFCIAAEKI